MDTTTQIDHKKKEDVVAPGKVQAITQAEKGLYEKVYMGQYPSTGYSVDLAEFIINTARRGDALLDMGCGRGRAVRHLRERGYRCLGIDITLRGAKGVSTNHPLPDMVGFTEAPLWKMPFQNNQFEYTFSTDVMEHIPPEMVDAVIKEIYRVTRVEMFLCISTIDDVNYENLHKTIQPIAWWRKQFARFNFKAVDTHIVDPETLIMLCHYVTKRRVG